MTTPSREERLHLYLPLLAQGHGYRRIARATGMSPNTVKADLRELRKGSIPHKPETVSPLSNTPAYTPLDWNVQADRIGNLILSLIDDALKSGREDDARKWIDRFFRGMTSKFGALRLTQINVDYKNLVFQELPEDVKENFTKQVLRELMDEMMKDKRCVIFEGNQCPLKLND